MGMYTELHFNARLMDDTPEPIMELLRRMVEGDGEQAEARPDHPLFKTRRWTCMLNCNSAYFDAETDSRIAVEFEAETYERRLICVRTNLKNYDSEIEKFIDWITPYLAKDPGDFLGFYRYEEDEQPTLIFMPGVSGE